jgi:hypothetical protein
MIVNKENVWFWATEHTLRFHKKGSQWRKVTVWVFILSYSLIGPLFFNNTVNSNPYVEVLQNDFMPLLMATQLFMGSQWFMRDDAMPHTADAVLYFLAFFF